MPTYAPPSQWNRIAQEQSERARKLREDVERSSSPISRSLQTLAHIAGKRDGKASDDAIRHIENIKESMAEDAEQQVADQYPKGTRVYDRLSRNRAGYGKPVDLPPEGKAKGGKVKSYAKGGVTRADGCVTKGHTKGKMR